MIRVVPVDQRKGKERMFQILQCLNINKIHKPVMHVQNVCCPHFPRLCFFETEACFNYRRPRTRIEIVKSQIIIDDKGRVLKTKVPQLVSSLHKRMLILLPQSLKVYFLFTNRMEKVLMNPGILILLFLLC